MNPPTITYRDYFWLPPSARRANVLDEVIPAELRAYLEESPRNVYDVRAAYLRVREWNPTVILTVAHTNHNPVPMALLVAHLLGGIPVHICQREEVKPTNRPKERWDDGRVMYSLGNRRFSLSEETPIFASDRAIVIDKRICSGATFQALRLLLSEFFGCSLKGYFVVEKVGDAVYYDEHRLVELVDHLRPATT